MMNYHFQGDPSNTISGSPFFFQLEAGLEFLRIKAAPSVNGLLQWILFKPDGSLYAQGFHMGMGKTLSVVPGKQIPYGASSSSLTEGRWTVWIIAIGPESEAEGRSWQLDIQCGGASDTPAEEGEESEAGPSGFWLDDENTGVKAYAQKSFHPLQAWYRGDFHVHTTCSDGKMPPSRVAREAHGQGLDFFAITDHNFFHTGWADASMPVIPGMELTLEKGHFNLFTANTLPHLQESFWHDLSGHVGELEPHLGNPDTVVSVNHPFLVPWEVRDENLSLDRIHGMEIICDPLWSTSAEASEKALKALSLLWNRGYRITGLGGSDIHNPPEELYEGAGEPARIGLPSTWVFAEELSVKALLDAVKEHKVYVAMGFTLELHAQYCGKEYGIGSCLSLQEEQTVTFTVCITPTDPTSCVEYHAEVIENTGNTENLPLAANQPACISRQWDGGYHWLRMDIRDSQGKLCGFTNPIYSGKTEIEKTLWRNLLELIG